VGTVCTFLLAQCGQPAMGQYVMTCWQIEGPVFVVDWGISYTRCRDGDSAQFNPWLSSELPPTNGSGASHLAVGILLGSTRTAIIGY